jgi:hypothetical protein
MLATEKFGGDKPDRNRPLRETWHRYGNIKTDLKAMGSDGADWFNLT